MSGFALEVTGCCRDALNALFKIGNLCWRSSNCGHILESDEVQVIRVDEVVLFLYGVYGKFGSPEPILQWSGRQNQSLYVYPVIST
jgi:hypothetical protein